jgi:hypothetical protein
MCLVTMIAFSMQSLKEKMGNLEKRLDSRMRSGEVDTTEDMGTEVVMVEVMVVGMGLDMVEDTTMATEEAMGPDMVEDTDLDTVVGMVALDMVNLGMVEDMAEGMVVAMEEDMVVAAGMVEVGAMEVDMAVAVAATLGMDIMVD